MMQSDYENSSPSPIPKCIVFSWTLNAFISTDASPEPIHEKVFFMNYKREDLKNRWTIPEMLMDVRWLEEISLLVKNDSNRILREETEQEFPYFLHEFSLNLIETKLLSWARDSEDHFQKWKNELNDTPFPIPADNDPLWARSASWMQKSPSCSEQDQLDLEQLLSIAQQVLKASLHDERSIKKAARDFTAEIRAFFGEESIPTTFNLQGPYAPSDALWKKASVFSQKIHDFFYNKLWRTNNQQKEWFSKLQQKLLHVCDDLVFPEISAQDTYHNALFKNLQYVANHICDRLNQSGKIELEAIQKVMESLKISKDAETQKAYKNYLKNSASRCVALLILDDSRRLLSFSGFLDCTDPDTLNLLGESKKDELLSIFQQIADGVNAKYIPFCYQVVENTFRYQLNEVLDFDPPISMRWEISQKMFQKKSYSCCERKLLAWLKCQSIQPESAKLIIKFEPCVSCLGALLDWKKTGNHLHPVNLQVYFPKRTPFS